MVLGEVVAEKPGVIGRLQQLQALFVETVDWTGAAVDPIEHAKADLVHRRSPLSVSRDPRTPRRRAQRNSGEAVPANRETSASPARTGSSAPFSVIRQATIEPP